MNVFKYLNDPHKVTVAILKGMKRLGKLAIVDLAIYNVKKLSQKLLGLRPETVDRLPRRYLAFVYGFSILATIHLWGIILAGTSGDALSVIYFIFSTMGFYGLALLVIRAYPRGFLNSLIGLYHRIGGLVDRLVEAIRETRE